jgi:hypothetical protein
MRKRGWLFLGDVDKGERMNAPAPAQERERLIQESAIKAADDVDTPQEKCERIRIAEAVARDFHSSIDNNPPQDLVGAIFAASPSDAWFMCRDADYHCIEELSAVALMEKAKAYDELAAVAQHAAFHFDDVADDCRRMARDKYQRGRKH